MRIKPFISNTCITKIPLHTDIYYIIAGVGEMRETLQNIANELGLHQRVFTRI